MVFAWKGWGIFIPIIGLAVYCLTGYAMAAFATFLGLQPRGMWRETLEMFPFLTISSAYWFIGCVLNKNSERVVTDEKTGRSILVKSEHTFCFIPYRGWAVIVLSIGIYIVLYSWVLKLSAGR